MGGEAKRAFFIVLQLIYHRLADRQLITMGPDKNLAMWVGMKVTIGAIDQVKNLYALYHDNCEAEWVGNAKPNLHPIKAIQDPNLSPLGSCDLEGGRILILKRYEFCKASP